MDLLKAIEVSGSGLNAQSIRIRMISENIANADSVITEDTTDPYRRKEILFRAALDRAGGMTRVEVAGIQEDTKTPVSQTFDPAHPLANDEGYVRSPNVNKTIENINLREAARSYEANLQAIESAKDMMSRTLNLLR